MMFRALAFLLFVTALPGYSFADKLYETTVKGGKLVVYGGVNQRSGDMVFYYSWYLRVAGHKVSQGRGNVTLDIPNRGSSLNLIYNNGSTELRYRARQQADQRIKLDIDGRFTLHSDPKTSWYPLLSATIPLNGGPEQRNNRTPSRAVFHIQNGWLEDQNGDRPDVFLNIERGRIESTTILPGWHSALWRFENAPFDRHVYIRNVFRPDHYLHMENGRLECGPIQKGWNSAMWKFTKQPDFGDTIQNLHTQQCLHMQTPNGSLATGQIDAGWHSARWLVHYVGEL